MCGACPRGGSGPVQARVVQRMANHEESRKPIIEQEVSPLGMN